MIDQDNFEIIENKEKSAARYYVAPNTAYLDQLLEGDIPQPYDTNWVFYEVFKMAPKAFINYIETQRNAIIENVNGFPYMSFHFKSYCDASLFLSDFYNRKNNLFPENF